MLAPLKPEDLDQQVAIGELTLSPEGDLAVYTRRTIVDGRDRIDLWAVRWDGGSPWPLTASPELDRAPCFSPAGDRLAFVRTGKDGRGRAMLVDPRPRAAVPSSGAGDAPSSDAGVGLPPEGGPVPEAVPAPAAPDALADVERDLRALAWTPDGDALIVLAEDEETPDEVPAGVGETPTCRTIRRLDWRQEGPGLSLRRLHLHRLPVDGGAPVRLTSGDWSAEAPAVAADGRVLFLADREADADRRPRRQLHALAAGGAPVASATTPVALTALPGGVERFAIEADGSIVLLGHAVRDPRDADPPRAFRLAIGEPTAEPVPLAPGLDRWLGQAGDGTDLHDWWSEPDDAGAVTGVADGGRVVPHRLDEHGARPLVDPATWPVCGALAASSSRVAGVLNFGVGVSAPDVYALEPSGPRRLTDHGAAWLDGFALPTVERLELAGPAGPITTFLVRPPGDRPEQQRATILSVHGGPTAQWAAIPPLEAILLAGAGYRVALPNIRGSIDRGPQWAAPLHGALGTVDAADVHAVLDGLVADHAADPDRLGVSGLSYGGFLTQWLVGTSDRFAAAVAENGVANQVSAWAGCDIGPRYAEAAGLGDTTTADGVAALWAASPLRHAAAIRTPLLLLQAEDDRRCPASDNEQLFTALRWLRRPVEYVLYPDEGHLYQGDGRFDRRVDRHRRTLDWFLRQMAP